MMAENLVDSEVDMDKGPPPDTNNEKIQQIVKWKNRVRMAWVSVCSNIVIILLMLFFVPTEKARVILPLIETFTMANVVIVFSYMGTTTAPWLGIFKGK